MLKIKLTYWLIALLLGIFLWFVIIKNLVSGNIFLALETQFTNAPVNVSITKLLSNPEKYHLIRIATEGYINLEFEGNAIYPYEEDYKQGLLLNAVWLDFPKNLNGIEVNKKYCHIEGFFDANSRGHKNLFQSTIKDILQIYPTFKPSVNSIIN